MKKIVLVICLLLSSLCISGCNKNKLEDEVSIIVPYGSPYLAIGGLIEVENLKIEAVNGAQNLQTTLVSGSHDIVIAPINLGAKLFNGGKSNYKIAAVLTLNNTYIITREENKLESIEDLENEKVLGFGQTGIPGSILTKLYNENSFLDINNVDFTFASSSAVYSVFSGGSSDAKYALMSEPEISKLVLNDNIKVKTLDLSKLLDINVVQACVYINPNSENLEEVEKVLSMIKDNVSFLNDNPNEYADKILSLDRTFNETGKEVLIRSIPLTNIVYKEAMEYKNEINNILSILGVKNPDDSFYY
jgi:ABC-type nitrate/sulfonate/bicarbonate transport system substrate-binding protein